MDRAAELPPLRALRRASLARRFASGRAGHAFHGVYPSFEAAQAGAPASLPLGYDNPAAAGMYAGRLEMDDHDYPALFWVGQSLQQGMRRVADLGGSIGIKYFAFQAHLEYPADLTWQVIEVPAVAERGREFARARQAEATLSFAESLAAADGADLLLASGSLQYLPQSLADIVGGMARKPRRLLVNTTPIHPERSYFTLNCIGTAFCPYRVTARAEFVGSLEAQGYRLRADWRNLNKRLELPGLPGLSLDHYTGFCFDATA